MPLVRLIKDGSATSQLQAAAALAEVGLVSANRDVIAKAGGIAPLVAMLSSATPGSAETAARTLANLARENEAPSSSAAPASAPAADANAPSAAPAPEATSAPVAEAPSASSAPSAASLATVGDVAVVAAQKVRDEVEGGPARRALIKAAGGVRKLIQLLDPNGPQDDGSPKDPKTGQQLWKQVQNVVAVVGECGVAAFVCMSYYM